MDTKTTIERNLMSGEQGHQGTENGSKKAYQAKECAEVNRQRSDHAPKIQPKDEKFEKRQQQQLQSILEQHRESQVAMVTETVVKEDMIPCEYCKKYIERGSMDTHHKEECEKVDRPRVQTSDHTPRELSVEDKLKLLYKEFRMKLQEQQKIMERRLEKQQEEMERRFQKKQKEQRNTEQALNQRVDAIKSQHENNNKDLRTTQFWITVITIAVGVIILGLVLGLAQKHHELEQKLIQKIIQLTCPGSEPYHSASSCQQILDCNSSSSSGYYWIAPSRRQCCTHVLQHEQSLWGSQWGVDEGC